MKKNKILLLLSITIILIIIVTVFFTVNLEQTTYKQLWSKSFGSEKSDDGYYITSIDDGGCIVLGYTTNDLGYTDIYLIKIDENGNKKWEKTYGGDGNDYGKSLIKTEDGYVILGFSNSAALVEYNYDIYLLKIDQNGNKIWENTYGGNRTEEASSLLETNEGNYIITGYTNSYTNPEGDLWIIEVENNEGKTIWNQTYGGTGPDEGRWIIEKDDGYIIAGQTYAYSKDYNYSDAWLLKISKTGEHIWNYTYGSEYSDRFNHIIPTDDGFIMVGHTLSKTNNNQDKWNGYIVKTDENGIQQWTRTLNEIKDTGISCIEETNDGYIILGYIGKYGEDDLLIEKVDKQGNRIWMQTNGGNYSDAGIWVDKGLNNNYYVTGYTDSKGTGFTDLWVMKLILN